jgi:hypothetical protein
MELAPHLGRLAIGSSSRPVDGPRADELTERAELVGKIRCGPVDVQRLGQRVT